MLSEIGSNFWICPNDGKAGKPLGSPCQFGYQGSDYVWMSTGRSATKLVLQTIEGRDPQCHKVALLPPFTCHTVYEPFMDFGYEIHTLPMNLDLSIDATDLACCIEEYGASVVLVHRYFGFDTMPGFDYVVESWQRKGVVFIEDCTQCLYSGFPISNVDYVVASIRKWCSAPDGGFAICKHGRFSFKPRVSDERMVESKRIASEMKYLYLFEGKGDKPTYKAKYREAESILDNQESFYAIGNLSAAIQAELDVESLKKKRRENFLVLLEGLRNTAGIKVVFDELPKGVTPLYCPILADNRSQLQDRLANNDIYAPVVWPKADNCPIVGDNAETVYEKILCIPIDQRYGIEDMQRIVKVMHS